MSRCLDLYPWVVCMVTVYPVSRCLEDVGIVSRCQYSVWKVSQFVEKLDTGAEGVSVSQQCPEGVWTVCRKYLGVWIVSGCLDSAW